MGIGATAYSRRELRMAIQAYEELERRFGRAPEPALQEEWARALVNRGDAYRLMGRYEEAIAPLSRAIELGQGSALRSRAET